MVSPGVQRLIIGKRPFAFSPSPIAGTGSTSDRNRVSLTASASSTFFVPIALKGKKVFGATLEVSPGSFSCIGVGLSVSAGGSIGIDGTRSIGYYNNAAVFYNSSNIASGGGNVTFAVGNTVGCVVDEPNGQIWFTVGTSNLYTGAANSLTKAQVEAGTSPFNILPILAQGAIYAMAGSFTTLGQQWRLSAFPGDIPAGYTSLKV